MKTSHSIVFHFERDRNFHSVVNESVILERMLNGRREEICRFAIQYDVPIAHLRHEKCSSLYDNRVLMNLTNTFRDRITFDVTISNAKESDNGTFMILRELSRASKCYTVFILSRYIFFT